MVYISISLSQSFALNAETLEPQKLFENKHLEASCCLSPEVAVEDLLDIVYLFLTILYISLSLLLPLSSSNTLCRSPSISGNA